MPANPPSTQFLDVATATAEADLDTPAERSAFAGTGVSTGLGNEWDFGTVDISGGAANSAVKTLFWRVTEANGNDTVDNFKVWLSNEGFDQVASVMRFTDGGLSFDDTGAPANTQTYVQSAGIGTYTFADIPTPAEPGAQNVYAANDAGSITITNITSPTPSEVVAFAAYFAIADEETTGTYRGLKIDYQLQCSFKFDYS
jgi:hypothetical protein